MRHAPPDSTVESIRKNKIALKEPVTTPIGTGFRSVNVALRKQLDLYACLRPCKSFKGVVTTLYENVDIVVVRENTEDLYIGIEFASGTEEAKQLHSFISQHFKGQVHPGSGYSIKAISEFGSRRIVKYAFDYARKYKRKKVAAVSKANIMNHRGLFLSTARRLRTPEIEYEESWWTPAHALQSPQMHDVWSAQPVRRHHLRSVRRAGGRAGTGAGRQYRRRHSGLRADARQRA
jgi:isocitrate dehydrogenase (NAD+)